MSARCKYIGDVHTNTLKQAADSKREPLLSRTATAHYCCWWQSTSVLLGRAERDIFGGDVEVARCNQGQGTGIGVPRPGARYE